MLTRAAARAFSTKSLKVVNNVAKQQFIVSLHGDDAILNYDIHGKHITLIRTDVPPVFQGKGVGKLLAKHAFDYAVENKMQVTCKCHFLCNFYQNNKNAYKSLNVKFDLND